MTALLFIPLLIVGAALVSLPMAWMLMLALGNFGFAQYGLVDVLPASLFVAMAFGQAKPDKDSGR